MYSLFKGWSQFWINGGGIQTCKVAKLNWIPSRQPPMCHLLSDIFILLSSTSLPSVRGGREWRDFRGKKGVRGRRGSRAGSGCEEVIGLNPRRLTADWCFLLENRHLSLQINLWLFDTDGAFRGLATKSSRDKIIYLKFKMVIPLFSF